MFITPEVMAKSAASQTERPDYCDAVKVQHPHRVLWRELQTVIENKDFVKKWRGIVPSEKGQAANINKTRCFYLKHLERD